MMNCKKIVTFINVALFICICIFNCFGPCKLFSLAGKNFSLSFYLSIIALPVFYISYFAFGRHDVDFVFKNLLAAFFLLSISSMGMALIISPTFSLLFNKTPMNVVFLGMVKYCYDIAMIPYFCFMLSFVKKKWACRIIDIFILAFICFGLFQCVCFYANQPLLWKAYDAVDILKVVGGDSAMYARIRHNYGTFRFYGFASEPAENCVLFCFLTLYLYWRITRCFASKKTLVFYCVCSILLGILAILTKSASVLTGLLIIGIGLFVYGVYEKRISTKAIIALVVLFCVLSVLLAIIPKTRAIFYQNFILKLFDRTNQSTQYRYSTIWNDLCILLQFPFFGVGDGNQGYFYAANVSDTWMSASPETQLALQGKMGLIGGGAAIPSFVSGFGIFGLIVLALCIRSYLIYAKKTNKKLSSLKPYLIMLGVSFFVLALATTGIHRNYWLFLFAASPLLGRYAIDSCPLHQLCTHRTERYQKVAVTKYQL